MSRRFQFSLGRLLGATAWLSLSSVVFGNFVRGYWGDWSLWYGTLAGMLAGMGGHRKDDHARRQNVGATVSRRG